MAKRQQQAQDHRNRWPRSAADLLSCRRLEEELAMYEALIISMMSHELKTPITSLTGKDGRELVKSLKSQQETKRIPVLMFSAHPSAQETAQQAGADDFLEKPFDIDVLLAKIAQYLQ